MGREQTLLIPSYWPWGNIRNRLERFVVPAATSKTTSEHFPNLTETVTAQLNPTGGARVWQESCAWGRDKWVGSWTWVLDGRTMGKKYFHNISPAKTRGNPSQSGQNR